MLDEIGEVLRSLARQTPPNSGDGLPGLMRALRQAVRLASLSPGRKGELLDLFIESARSFLDGWFESEPVKAAFGFDAVVGNYASPDSLGSAYVLLHHTFGEVNGKKGAWGHVLGGMGAITQAMAKSCEALGVEILIDAPVRQVLVDGGKAAGVELADGRHIGAGIVASNVNPSLLFQGLVAPTDLPAEFRARIARYRNGSGTFRMNVALSELPDFTCLPGKAVAERFWATPATACRDPSGRWRLRQSGVERRARDPARSKPAHRDRLGPARPLTWSPSMTDATIADPDDDVGLPNPIASKRCSPPAARCSEPGPSTGRPSATTIPMACTSPWARRLFGRGYGFVAAPWVDKMWGRLRDAPSDNASERALPGAACARLDGLVPSCPKWWSRGDQGVDRT
jgi:hypothetical protein